MQGLAWGEMKKLWKNGFLAYIIVPWNLADIFTLANFMGWIGTYMCLTQVASSFMGWNGTFVPHLKSSLLSRLTSPSLSYGAKGDMGWGQT